MITFDTIQMKYIQYIADLAWSDDLERSGLPCSLNKTERKIHTKNCYPLIMLIPAQIQFICSSDFYKRSR